MFKANNNNFIGKSKIKIPKIRPFYNLKSAKIFEKRTKIGVRMGGGFVKLENRVI